MNHETELMLPVEETSKVNPINPIYHRSRQNIESSLGRLQEWLESNDYRGYDTFDGLNAKYVRALTFETKLLRTILQQGVRRFPINPRRLLGIEKGHSTKGMGFIVRGYIRLHEKTGNPHYQKKPNRCSPGSYSTNPPAIAARVGAITSITNPAALMCLGTFLQWFGRL